VPPPRSLRGTVDAPARGSAPRQAPQRSAFGRRRPALARSASSHQFAEGMQDDRRGIAAYTNCVRSTTPPEREVTDLLLHILTRRENFDRRSSRCTRRTRMRPRLCRRSGALKEKNGLAELITEPSLSLRLQPAAWIPSRGAARVLWKDYAHFRSVATHGAIDSEGHPLPWYAYPAIEPTGPPRFRAFGYGDNVCSIAVLDPCCCRHIFRAHADRSTRETLRLDDAVRRVRRVHHRSPAKARPVC